MAESGTSIKDTLVAADAALRAGDASRALGFYSRVLAQAPNHSAARKAVQKMRRTAGLGANLTQADVDQVVAWLGTGEIERAVDQTRLLITLAPREALLPNILGMALAQLGRSSEAIAAFRNAVKVNPQYAEAHSNLGSALVQVDDLEKARSHLQKAVALNPNLPEAHNSLATVYRHDRRYGEALAAVDAALGLRPDYANAFNTKGTILLKMARDIEALECFEKGLRSEPNNSEILLNRGLAMAENGDMEGAIRALEDALPKTGELARTEHELGILLANAGRKDTAIQHFEDAIHHDPTLAEAYRNLAILKKFEAGDPLIGRMKDIIADTNCPEDAKMHLGFALGKALEDIGEPKAAFEFLNVGNRIKRKLVLPYSTAEESAFFDGVRETFTPAFAAGLKPAANPSDKPIFIVGMNRSGTTLVEQILASHSQVFGADEQTYIGAFGQQHAKELGKLPVGRYGELVRGYLDLLTRLSDGQARVTDKMPNNFLWIGMIAPLFPNAKIINLTRDPRDNCLSIYKNYFRSSGNQYSYDLTELAEFYLLYRDLMDHWHAMFPGRIYELSYEKLTGDQENQTRALLEYCDLDWEGSVMDFHKTRRNVMTASLGQVRQKMYQSSVRSWKKFETELQPLIRVIEAAGRLPEQESGKGT